MCDVCRKSTEARVIDEMVCVNRVRQALLSCNFSPQVTAAC